MSILNRLFRIVIDDLIFQGALKDLHGDFELTGYPVTLGRQKNPMMIRKSRTAMCLTNRQKNDSFFRLLVKPDTNRIVQKFHDFFISVLSKSRVFAMQKNKQIATLNELVIQLCQVIKKISMMIRNLELQCV